MKPIMAEEVLVSGQVLRAAGVKIYQAAQAADLTGCESASKMLARVSVMLNDSAHLSPKGFATSAQGIYDAMKFDSGSKVTTNDRRFLRDFLANALRLASNLHGDVLTLTTDTTSSTKKSKGKKR